MKINASAHWLSEHLFTPFRLNMQCQLECSMSWSADEIILVLGSKANRPKHHLSFLFRPSSNLANGALFMTAQENLSFNDLWWCMYFGDYSIVSVADIIQEVRDRHQALVLSSMASSQTLSYSRLLMQDGPGPSPSLPHQIKWANTHHGAGQTLRRAFHWNEPRNLPTRSSSDLWLTMSDHWGGLQE